MGFREELIGSPLLYPIGFDPKTDVVQFIRLTEAAYEAAAFLDQRLLTPGMPIATGPWKPIAQAAAGLPERCHFIFHISHVGSTLLARLLGAHPQLFALREPAVLRLFAELQLKPGGVDRAWSVDEFHRRLGVFMGLWSRTYHPAQRSIIKATSFASEMAELLLSRQADARAIFMFVKPRVFLQALLGGAMTDIDQNAENRLVRLHRRLGETRWRLIDLSPGQRVAMSWLSEMLALDDASQRFPERTLWLDFDAFLASPESHLTLTLRHLAVTADPQWVAGAVAGPATRTYAKATQFEFDAASRANILRDAQGKHADEIARGEAWLNEAAGRFQAVQAIVANAATVSVGRG